MFINIGILLNKYPCNINALSIIRMFVLVLYKWDKMVLNSIVLISAKRMTLN